MYIPIVCDTLMHVLSETGVAWNITNPSAFLGLAMNSVSYVADKWNNNTTSTAHCTAAAQ